MAPPLQSPGFCDKSLLGRFLPLKGSRHFVFVAGLGGGERKSVPGPQALPSLKRKLFTCTADDVGNIQGSHFSCLFPPQLQSTTLLQGRITWSIAACEFLLPGAQALLQISGQSLLTLHAQCFQLSPEDTQALLVGAASAQQLLVVSVCTTGSNVTL